MKTHFYVSKFDKKFFSSKPKLYAGEWLLSEKEKEKILIFDKKNKVIGNLWNNKKYDYDYKLSKYLLNYCSSLLREYLNKLNNVKRTKRYWDIILLPWLIHYLPSLLYRWRTIEKAFKLENNLFFFKINNFEQITYNTTIDFVRNIRNNDNYNYYLYLKILESFKKKNKYKIFFIKKKLKKKKIKIKKKIFYFRKFFILLEKINFFFSKLNNLYFDFLLLKRKYYFKFCFHLNLIPQFFFNRVINHSYVENLELNSKLREKFIIKKNKKIKNQFLKDKSFINFINENIHNDIPKCYIEGFKILLKQTEKIKFKPKLIFSGYNHFYNELFKVWTSELIHKYQSKLICCVHGGGQNLRYPASFNFENKISNEFIAIHKDKKNKHKLSLLKLVGLKKQSKEDNLLTYIASPKSIYPYNIYRFSSFEEVNYNNVLNLNKYLDASIYKKLVYLPSVHSSNFENLKIKKILRNENIKRENSLNYYSKKSNLIVCSYAETAFLESIFIRPTILLCEKNKIELIKSHNFIIKKLIKNKILFFCVKEASNHINKIWLNTDYWWETKKVKDTIEELKILYCNTNKTNKILVDWVNFIKEKNEVQ